MDSTTTLKRIKEDEERANLSDLGKNILTGYS